MTIINRKIGSAQLFGASLNWQGERLFKVQHESRVGLDAVALSDGTVLGPDTGQMVEKLNTLVTAERDLANEVLNQRSEDLRGFLDLASAGSSPSVVSSSAYLGHRVDAKVVSQIATSYAAEIRRTVDMVALYQLMALAAGEPVSPQARAIAASKIDELKKYIAARTWTDDSDRAHAFFAAAQITKFQQDPKQLQLPAPATAPPGQPIGEI